MARFSNSGAAQLTGPAIVLAILLAGCHEARQSSSAPTPQASGHVAGPVAASAPPTSSPGTGSGASSLAASDPPVGACAARSLRARIGTRGGAAGTAFVQVQVRNTGSVGCVLPNFAQTTLVTDTGRHVAVLRHYRVPHRRPVVLAPGGWAHLALAIPEPANVPAELCDRVTLRSVDVALPPGRVATSVELRWTACARPDNRPAMSPLLPGRSAHAV
jgi:hypothetical protein